MNLNYSILIIAVLYIFLLSVLSGCSPTGIRITEEVIEDVAEEELKGGANG